MNPGYPRVYTPVLRSPLLFHHNTGLSGLTYNPAQPGAAQVTTNLYSLHSNSHYGPQPQPQPQPQPRYTVQAPLPYNPQSFPYYSAMPQGMVYSIPTATYASTASSKGLSLILIATLILVALDLVIVRPQKR